MDERTLEAAVALLRCSVCDGICTPEAKQCKNGHLTCNVCLRKLASNTCPVCRAPGPGSSRNLSVDGLVALLNPVVACPLADRGCHATFKYSQLPQHAAVDCTASQDFPCPTRRCKTKLPKERLFSHFCAQHSASSLDNVNYLHLKPIFDQESQGQTYELSTHDRKFFLTSFVMGSDWCIFVWLLGERNEADHFEYTVVIPGPHDVADEVFTAKVVSLRDGPEVVLGQNRCYKTSKSIGDHKPFVIQIKVKKL